MTPLLSGTRTVSMATAAPIVAANIRAEMSRRKVTQATLATGIGMSQSAVSKRLNGNLDWSVSELESVASFLDVPFALLVEGVAA